MMCLYLIPPLKFKYVGLPSVEQPILRATLGKFGKVQRIARPVKSIIIEESP